MSNLPVNSKSFNLTNIVSKSFSLALSGFQFVTSLFFNISSVIDIGFVSSALLKIVTNINLGKVDLDISSKATISQTQSVDARRISLGVVFSEIGSVILSVVLRQPITYVLSSIVKFTTTMDWKLPIDFVPTLAVFFTLGDHDPSTLATFDSQTLADMDFTV